MRCKINVYSIREKSGSTLLDNQNCYPWTVSIVSSNRANKTAKIKLAPGSINGVVPSNIGLEFDVTTDGVVYYIYCSVTATNGSVQGCTLAVSTTVPSGVGVSMGTPPTSFDVFIGSFSLEKAVVSKENIYLEVYEAYRASKTPSFPGDRPYNIYYSWKKS